MPACRRTVQRFIDFLDPQSAAAFKMGASLIDIDDFQLKTRFRLPWQVNCSALLSRAVQAQQTRSYCELHCTFLPASAILHMPSRAER